MTNYKEQAADFAAKNGITLHVLSVDYKKHFIDDNQPRWVFRCRLKRKGKQYTFEFGQSIANGGEEPDMYDVLICLAKYDPENFEYFCSEYGYDDDSIKAFRIYNAVKREWAGVKRLFGDILDELREIS